MDLKPLAARVAASEVTSNGRRKYSNTLKQDLVAALSQSGRTIQAFCAEVGIVEINLVKWRRIFRTKPAIKHIEEFKTFPIDEPARKNSFVIRGPGGFSIEGLDLKDCGDLMMTLARSMSC